MTLAVAKGFSYLHIKRKILFVFLKNKNIKLMKFINISALVLVLLLVKLRGGDFKREEAIKLGIEQIYSLNFEGAEDTFKALKEKNAQDPAPAFFLAMIEWEKIQLNIEDESRDEIFFKKIDEAIKACDEQLKQNPKDYEALFFKGGAIGFKGRLLALREKWIDAAALGKDALPIVNEVYKLKPENIDILLGFGIYNYYAEAIPEQYPFTKPLLFFIPKGNKKLGINQLKKAAEEGKYANYEAAYFLIHILYDAENNFEEAEKYSLWLNKKFPNNPIFRRQLGRIYYKWGYFEKAFDIFKSIYEQSEAGDFGFSQRFKRDASYYLGVIYLNYKNNLDSALFYLSKCEELSLKIEQNKSKKSGFYVKSLYYQGEIYERMGFNQTAIKIYKDVVELNDYDNTRDRAKNKLKLLEAKKN